MAGVRSQPTFGDYLVREGIITQTQLNQALEEQLATSRSISRILVDKGFITEAVRMALLQKRFGYELIRLKNVNVDSLLLMLIPYSFAEKHRVVPVRKEEDGTLLVAMEDPSDIMVVDAMKAQLGIRLKPFVASQEDVQAVLDQYSVQAASHAQEVEAAQASESFMHKVAANFLFPVLMLLPLVLFFAAIYFDVNDLQKTVQSWFTTGALSEWDLIVYIALIWGTWAVVMFEITSLMFAKKNDEDDES